MAARALPDAFEARRRALLDAAAARGLAAVAVFGFGSAQGAGTKSHGALRYLTGWDGHESPTLAILTAERTHLLPASPFMVPLARELHGDLTIHDVRAPGWAQAIAELAGGVAGTVGFAEMPAALHQGLSVLTQAPALDDDLARQRLVKDAAELQGHRAAAALCDLLFARLGDQLARRVPAWQVQLDLEMAARSAGADYCRTWLTIAPAADRCRYWREETQRVPQAGDQVLLGIALTVEGHWGHGIRMGSIGPQKAEHRALAEQVEAMLGFGLAATRPGAPLAGIEATMEAELARRGGAAALPGLSRFRNGHGLGFSYEDPLLTDAFRQHFDASAPAAAAPDLALAPGMLLELHPNLFVPGVGGAALGEMVLVTAGAPECLISFPRCCVEWG